MSETQPRNDTVFARETLQRLSDSDSILHHVAHIAELVAHSTVGLGEVLQDYAHQASRQLKALLEASARTARGTGKPGDREVLQQIHYILKSVQSVLQRAPAAMERNKAPHLGEKEKLTPADISKAMEGFSKFPEIAHLLANEDAGVPLAALATAAGPSGLAPADGPERRMAVSH